MTIKDKIKTVFMGKAFDKPLFHSYDKGLRFSLSEGRGTIRQFLTAHCKCNGDSR